MRDFHPPLNKRAPAREAVKLERRISPARNTGRAAAFIQVPFFRSRPCNTRRRYMASRMMRTGTYLAVGRGSFRESLHASAYRQSRPFSSS